MSTQPRTARSGPGRPERGRLSELSGPRVYECEPESCGRDRSVPAAQAADTLAHNRADVQTHSLMPLLTGPHLYRAARSCMRRGGAPGADGVSWSAYRRGLKSNLADLEAALRTGTWRPGPVREVAISS